jgi:hypothetical protein
MSGWTGEPSLGLISVSATTLGLFPGRRASAKARADLRRIRALIPRRPRGVQTPDYRMPRWHARLHAWFKPSRRVRL